MKKLSALYLFLLLLTMTACAKPSQTEPTAAESLQSPSYSNLSDENSQKEVADRLKTAKVENVRVDTFLRWVKDFNSIEAYQLEDGFIPLEEAGVKYEPLTTAMAKRWSEKQGEYEDVSSRIAAFYLMEDFIQAPEIYNFSGAKSDEDAIEGNPGLVWEDGTKNKYYTVLSPVKIGDDFSTEQGADAVAEYWKENQVVISGTGISLITVWNEAETEGANHIFSGHAGVLIDDESGLLFIEKVLPLYPYQATKFSDRERLKKYLIDRQASVGMDTANVFVMENDVLME